MHYSNFNMNSAYLQPSLIKSCMDIILLATIFPEKMNCIVIIGHNGGYKFIVEYSLFQFNSELFMFNIIVDCLIYRRE